MSRTDRGRESCSDVSCTSPNANDDLLPSYSQKLYMHFPCRISTSYISYRLVSHHARPMMSRCA